MLKEQVVLFRAAHHSDQLEVELTRRNIPFVKYGGLKFMEAAHVKDTLAILRVLENPHDEVAWFRTLQLPEGMGPATARRLMQEIGVRADDLPSSPLTRFLDEPVEVPKAALDGVQELRSVLRGCADETVLTPAAQIERLRGFLAPVLAGATTRRPPGSAISTSSRRSPPVTRFASGSSRSSRSIRRRRPATSPAPRSSTRTGSCSRRSIRPRGSSGTSCT